MDPRIIDEGVSVLKQMCDALSPTVDTLRVKLPLIKSMAEFTKDGVGYFTITQSTIDDFDKTIQFVKSVNSMGSDVSVMMSNMEGCHAKLKDIHRRLQNHASFYTKILENNLHVEKENDYSMMENTQMKLQLQKALILCKRCGATIEYNEHILCSDCICYAEQDSGLLSIPNRLSISSCRHCDRWQRNNTTWFQANYESAELMAVLLKKIPGLDRKSVKLLDSKFLWSEPNSLRIKMQMVVLSVSNNLQKTLQVEWVVVQTACPECERSFTPHTWRAVVSLRQRGHNKSSLRQMENLIRQNDKQNNVVAVQPHTDGFDLMFARKTNAESFVKFIKKFYICKVSESSQLISHNANDNTANKKFTFAIQVAPVSRGDLVYIPKKLRNNTPYGGCPAFMIVQRITANIILMDPFTMRAVDVSSKQYWSSPFIVCSTIGHLTNFILLDFEELKLNLTSKIQSANRYSEGGRGAGRTNAKTATMTIATSRFKEEDISFSRYRPVEVELAKERDFGITDERYRVNCHIGLHIRVGDILEAYDLNSSSINVGPIYEEEAAEYIKKMRDKIMVYRINKQSKKSENDNPAISSQAYMEGMRDKIQKQQDRRWEKEFILGEDMINNGEPFINSDPEVELVNLMDNMKI